MTEQAVNYNDLITGYEFPPATFLIDSELADTYASAVGDTNSLYKDINAVPPTAAFAYHCQPEPYMFRRIWSSVQ
jgi:hypothetical protein